MERLPTDVLALIFRWTSSSTLLYVIPAVCRRWRHTLKSMVGVELDLPSLLVTLREPSEAEMVSQLCRHVRRFQSVAALTAEGWPANAVEKAFASLGRPSLASLLSVNFTMMTSNSPSLKQESVSEFHAVLKQLAEHCPQLVSVAFAGSDGLDSAGVALLTNALPGLESVDFSLSILVNSDALTSLGRHCPRLKTVNVSQTKVDDVGVVALARGCPDLVSINLEGCRVTDVAICALANYCSKLISLNALGAHEITDAALQIIAGNLPNITTLKISSVRLTTGVLALADACKQLDVLELPFQTVKLLGEVQPAFLIKYQQLAQQYVNFLYKYMDSNMGRDSFHARLQALFSAGANPDTFTISTPGLRPKPAPLLHVEAFEGRVHGIRMLLRAGATVDLIADTLSTPVQTPLLLATEKDDTESVRALLEGGACVNGASNGVVPLHFAIQSHARQVAAVLLAAGADVDIESGTGEVALHVAINTADLPMIRTLLEEYEANPNPPGQSLLHQAIILIEAKRGCIEIVQLLLDRGTLPTTVGFNGETPLHVAARYGMLDAIEALLAAGADPRALDADGNTPLERAQEQHDSFIERPGQPVLWDQAKAALRAAM
eukprot:m.21304 g.21304  ORF g.21304 m.21304 type:complete len:608 (+) comp5677_c0_seq1:381-2204(+)